MSTDSEVVAATTAPAVTESPPETLDLRQILDVLQRVLIKLDPTLRMWIEAKLGETGRRVPREFSPAELARMIGVLEDVKRSVASATSAQSIRREIAERREAVSKVKLAVLRQVLDYTRPVEEGYQRLSMIFKNAGDGARVCVFHATPEELDEQAFTDAGSDYLGEALPAKVRALREILERSNEVLDPFGWIGLTVVPDVDPVGFKHLRRALKAYGQRYKTMLINTPRYMLKDPGQREIDAILAAMGDDEQKILASGTDPRALQFIGDVVARDAYVVDGVTVDEPIVVAPVYAAAGAIGRNDRALGMHTPPSSIEPRAGGDISVDRVLYEFSAKECHRAWANKPQRLNVVFYSPQDNQVYLYGSNVSGSQQVNAYNSQRILDKMTVLVERLLLNKVFQREGSVAQQKVKYFNAASDIVRTQFKLRNIVERDAKIEITNKGPGLWDIQLAFRPAGTALRFAFTVAVDQNDPDGE